VASDRPDVPVAQSEDQIEQVLHEVEWPKRCQIAVVGRVPAGRSAVSALLGRYDVEPGGSQCRNHHPPAPSELRKSVQQ
jgi:hypothetical protein